MQLDEQKDVGETMRIVLYIVSSICIITLKQLNKIEYEEYMDID